MFPIMTEALGGLVQQAQFSLVVRAQEGFDTVEAPGLTRYFLASLQPINPRRLAAKPEGWRRWKWWTLWTTQQLEVGDYVRDVAGLQYRVMTKSDWSGAGYLEYEVTEASSVGSEAP